MDSYIYVYLDTRKPGCYIYSDITFDYEPFYVGKGYGDRAFNHLNEKKIVNNHKSGKINKIKKSGLLPKIVFLFKNLNNFDAEQKEIEIIKKIGRYPNGPLTNLTDGGDGSFGRIREKSSIEKQKESLKNNKIWWEKMKSENFSKQSSMRMKEYYSKEENRKMISERQIGNKNSMYGKPTSEFQKESVRRAHKEGKVKLTEEGRNNIILNNKKRKGIKNSKIKNDAIIYYLSSPNNEEYKIYGAVRLQEFCKINKIQFHVLKNNIGKKITKDLIIGKKIFAKNTIGWIIKN